MDTTTNLSVPGCVYICIYTARAPQHTPKHPAALLLSAILGTGNGKLTLPIQRLGLTLQKNASDQRLARSATELLIRKYEYVFGKREERRGEEMLFIV